MANKTKYDFTGLMDSASEAKDGKGNRSFAGLMDDDFGAGEVLSRDTAIERGISNRTTPIDDAREALTEIAGNPMLGATMNATSAKLMSAVTNSPRLIGESLLASPIYELMRGNVQGIPQAMAQAVTQEKPTRFSDIIRKTDLGGAEHNEWTAKSGGLALQLAGLDIATKKMVTTGVKDIGNLLFSKRPLHMNDTYLKLMTRKAFNGIESAKNTVGKLIGVVKKKVSDVEVDRKILNKILKDVPGVAKREIAKKLKIKETPSIELYDQFGKLMKREKEFISRKVTIDDVDNVKVLLGELRSNSSWVKGAKGLSESIKEKKIGEAYDKVRKFISSQLKGKGYVEEAKTLSGLNDRYTEIKKVGNAIKSKIMDATGEPVRTKAFVGMLSDKREAGGRDLIERFGKHTDEVGKAAKMASDYVMRQKILDVAKYIGKIGGLGGAVYAARGKVGHFISGESEG